RTARPPLSRLDPSRTAGQTPATAERKPGNIEGNDLERAQPARADADLSEPDSELPEKMPVEDGTEGLITDLADDREALALTSNEARKEKAEQDEQNEQEEVETRRRYRVKKRDTLAKIASWQLGNAELAGLLFDINAHIIPHAYRRGKTYLDL